MRSARNLLLLFWLPVSIIFVFSAIIFDDDNSQSSFTQAGSNQYKVQPIYFLPKDVSSSSKDREAITHGMEVVREFYRQKVDGKTFTFLPTKTVRGTKNKSAYSPSNEVAFYNNVVGDLSSLGYSACQDMMIYVIFMRGNPQRGYGLHCGGTDYEHPSGGGTALLGNDALDALQKRENSGYRSLAHELGHAFGLAHAYRSAYERDRSVVGGTGGLKNIFHAEFNFTPTAPEKQTLLASPFFGGSGKREPHCPITKDDYGTIYPEGKFRVCYQYASSGLPGKYLGETTESKIAHSWGNGPTLGGKNDRVFAVWFGTFSLSRGTYRFTLKTSDLALLSVGSNRLAGQIAIVAWGNGPTETTYTADVYVYSEKTALHLVWYDLGGPASISLAWRKISSMNTTHTDSPSPDFRTSLWQFSGGEPLNTNTRRSFRFRLPSLR